MSDHPECTTAAPGTTPERAVRVVLVDDDPLVRAGLRMILGGNQGVQLVGEAGDGVTAMDVIAEHRPDVALMDIRMPHRDGVEATRLVGERHPRTRVIVLTTFDTDAFVLAALRAGASGFLLKDTAPEEIVRAVHTVAAGEPMLSPSVTAQLIATLTEDPSDQRQARARRRLEPLTDREREVAVAIGNGRSNAEISAELYLSVPTVKAHVSRLLAKLDADNRVQVAICVHDAGLV
ncbi:MAG TPA: response regulator transcription factor [Segeticoccus sp.]|nr:response regulator transcription factor [Segeticoccus sp.]